MIAWSIAIATSVVLLVLTTVMRSGGIHMAYAHMLVSAATGIAFALMYMKERSGLIAAGAGASSLSALAARYLGLVWGWCALGLAAIYATGVLQWREWPYFLTASVVIAGLCMLYSSMLSRDAAAGREDQAILRLGRILTAIQLGGVIIAMIGLLIDGKMTRVLTASHPDWAANDIFFFGAAAIAVISGSALAAPRKA
ncbi:MAG: hypothetical protein AB7O43_02115 [Hyphomicrobiaceae bacterium]